MKLASDGTKRGIFSRQEKTTPCPDCNTPVTHHSVYQARCPKCKRERHKQYMKEYKLLAANVTVTYI